MKFGLRGEKEKECSLGGRPGLAVPHAQVAYSGSLSRSSVRHSCSAQDMDDPQLASSASEIAEKIRFGRANEDAPGKTVFFIGAGCSISAGIPGAADIARHMVQIVAERFGNKTEDSVVAYSFLVNGEYFPARPKGDPKAAPIDENIDWHAVYDEMFRRHYTAPDDVRELFDSLVTQAGGAINWAHLCLGELVARGYVSTVLTTNFDQLVLAGLVRAGVLPVICDGIESLNRIAGAPRHPQLVELHGSRHTYLLRNAPEDVEAVRRNSSAAAAIQKLLQHATTFVAVGYGGREAGVMHLLKQAAQVYPDKNIFWVNHAPRPDDIVDNVREFLSTSRNSRLLPGQDADTFFLELCRALQVGSPTAISKPLEVIERSINDASRATISDPDIQAEIDAAIRQLQRLQESNTETEPDAIEAVAAKIRETRLAGDHERAYRLAEEALAK